MNKEVFNRTPEKRVKCKCRGKVFKIFIEKDDVLRIECTKCGGIVLRFKQEKLK